MTLTLGERLDAAARANGCGVAAVARLALEAGLPQALRQLRRARDRRRDREVTA